jgi:hypothetical protein
LGRRCVALQPEAGFVSEFADGEHVTRF